MIRSLCLLGLSLVWLLSVVGSAAVAQTVTDVPADTCILRVSIPRGAKISIDGRQYNDRRKFTFDGLKPGRTYSIDVVVSLPGGSVEQRTILAVGGREVLLPIDIGERPELMVQGANSGEVSQLAYSPDGKYLFAGVQGAVVMWNVKTGRQVRQFRPQNLRIRTSLRFETTIDSMAVSSDGKRLLAGASDGAAHLWSVRSGEIVATSEGWLNAPQVAFSSDGASSAIGGFGIVQYGNSRDLNFKNHVEFRRNGKFQTMSGLVSTNDGSTLVAAIDEQPTSSNSGVSTDLKRLSEQYRRIKHEYLLMGWSAQDGKLRYRIAAHQKRINALAISPNSDIVATAADDGTACMWRAATGRLIRRIQVPGEEVECLAFSMDGSLLATANDEYPRAEVDVWNVATGKKVKSGTFDGDPSALAFSPDGVTLAVGNEDGQIRLWTLNDNRLDDPFQDGAGRVDAVAVSPDGGLIAVGAKDSHVGLWNTNTGDYVTLGSENSLVDADRLAFSSRGTQLAGIDYNDVYVWDIANGRLVTEYEHDKYSFDAIAFHPDSSRLLVGGDHNDNAIIATVDPQTGKLLAEQIVKSAKRFGVEAVAYSRDGRYAAIGHSPPTFSKGRTGLLLNAQSLKTIRRFDEPDTQAGTIATNGHVAFSHDGKRLLVGAWELWDIASGRKQSSVQGHVHQIQNVAFTPDGKRLLTVSWDHTARLWDVKTGRQIRRFLGHTAAVEAVAISSDGRFAATGGNDGRTFLWNLKTGKRMRLFQSDSKKIWSVAFSPDDRYLLTGSQNYTATLWQTFSGRRERTFSGDNYPVASVNFSPDGKQILTGSGNKTAVVWDRATGRRLRTLSGHSDSVMSTAFSPDGRYIATGSIDKLVMLWNARTGQRIKTLKWHSNSITHLQFSPNSKQLLSACWDNPAMLWDVSTGERVRAFQSSSSHGVPAAVFSPSGSRVATVSLDRSAVIWDRTSGERLQTLGAPIMVNDVVCSADGRLVLVGTTTGRLHLYDATSGRQLREFARQSVSVNSTKFTPDSRFALCGLSDGTVALFDVATGDQLASLISLNSGKDWLVVTPEGLFDGSQAGRESVDYRVGGGLQLVTVDRFFQDFYYPGLLAAIFRGERPRPGIDFGGHQPPLLTLVSPQSGSIDVHEVTIEVKATDQGGGVSNLAIFHNGARLLADGETRQEGMQVFRSFRVGMIEGTNHFRISATNADGSWESEPVEVTLNFERPLPKPKLFVVAVGINEYEDREGAALQFAVRDAHATSELFRQRGPALYSDIQVTTLLNEEATHPDILAAFETIAPQARPQDTLVVLLAGHGAVVKDNYYFLPHAFRTNEEPYLAAVRRGGLQASDIGRAMVRVPALKRMLILDTCRANSQLAATRTARNPFALRGAIERLGRAEGAFTIAAASVSDSAKEVPQLKHGLLTYTLLAGLRGVEGGPLRSRWIHTEEDSVPDVLQWFNFASTEAPRLSTQFFGATQDVQQVTTGTSFPVLPVLNAGDPPALLADDSSPERTTPKTRPSTPAVVESQTKEGHGDLHLISIGISNYRQDSLDLEFATGDARAIAKLFQKRAPGIYRRVHSHLLVDADATRAGIAKAFKQATKAANPDDALVIFLAGHGTMVGQRYFFIPHEYQQNGENLDESIRRQAIPIDNIAEMVSDVPARKQLILLDTCASGGALPVSSRVGDAFSLKGLFGGTNQRTGTFFVAATAANAEAHEIKPLRHGILTYALLSAFGEVKSEPNLNRRLRPSDPRGRINAMEWSSYVSGLVPRLTEQHLGFEQQVQTTSRGTAFPILLATPTTSISESKQPGATTGR